MKKSQFFDFLTLPLPLPGTFLTELVRARSKNRKFEIFSGRTQMIVKPFQGRTNISLMFLFPQSDCGIIILDFESIAFFDSEAIFGAYYSPWEAIFYMKDLTQNPPTFWEKKRKYENFFSESFRKCSKLLRNIFWASQDNLVAQKVEIKIIFFENVLNSCTCLLYTSPSPRDRQKSRMPSSA